MVWFSILVYFTRRSRRGHNQRWLQTITYHRDKENNDKDAYTMPLCRLVMDAGTELWNNGWLKAGLAASLPVDSIIDRATLETSAPVINFRERKDYCDDGVDDSDLSNFDYEETIVISL